MLESSQQLCVVCNPGIASAKSTGSPKGISGCHWPAVIQEGCAKGFCLGPRERVLAASFYPGTRGLADILCWDIVMVHASVSCALVVHAMAPHQVVHCDCGFKRSGLMQGSLEDLMETQPSLSDAFLNRLFALLNWTLTEFTISTQVPTFFQLQQNAPHLRSSLCSQEDNLIDVLFMPGH